MTEPEPEFVFDTFAPVVAPVTVELAANVTDKPLPSTSIAVPPLLVTAPVNPTLTVPVALVFFTTTPA